MSELQWPVVSVAIPTYRGARYIGAAIESVIQQSFSDFELIIIDDNSPDDTEAVVAGFKDARIRYIRNPTNLGPEGNWNRCLEMARGQYFKLMPHDDLLRQDCLQRQVLMLEADRGEKLALVFSARDVIDPDGHLIARRTYPGAAEGAIAGDEVMRRCIRRGTNLIGEPGGVLLRKSLADRVGRFDAANPYVIDLDYWFRLLEHGAACYVPEHLVAFRVSRQQWSVVIGTGQSRDFRDFVDRTTARMGLSVGLVDRLCGQWTPTLNTLARLLFYRLFLR